MKETKADLSIPLTNGCRLCVNKSNDPDYPNELYVYLKMPDGCMREIVCVMQNYTYPKDKDGIAYLPDQIKILLSRTGTTDYVDEKVIDIGEDLKECTEREEPSND